MQEVDHLLIRLIHYFDIYIKWIYVNKGRVYKRQPRGQNDHKWPTYDHHVLKCPLMMKMADKAIGKNLLKSFNEDQK